MSVRVEYIANSEPNKVGEWRGDPILAFGAYKVRLEDGFTVLSAHTGFPGTVSEWPVDLELNPDFRDHLIAEARRICDLTEHGLPDDDD